MRRAGLACEALTGGGGGVELEEEVLLTEGEAVVPLTGNEELGFVVGEETEDG